MKGHLGKFVLGLAALSAAFVGLADTADAGKRRRAYDDEPGVYRYVRAEASIGGATVVGAVRPGKWGDQVRTPAGNWYDCEITCEYTLRRLTVDFWDTQGRNAIGSSPGYFRWDIDPDTGRTYRRGPKVFGRY
jgi:hypothetical protein